MPDSAKDKIIKVLEEKLGKMPCTEHLERLVLLETTLKQIDKALSKVVEAVQNGESSLVISVERLKQQVQYLEQWQAKHIAEQERQRELLEAARQRGKWHLIAAIAGPVAVAAITWFLTRLV